MKTAWHELPQSEAGANGKPRVLAHADRFRPQAEEACRRLISSWIAYGPRETNHCDPDKMPGVFPEVAEGVLAAMLNHGAQDFGDIRGYFIGAPAGILDELSEANMSVPPGAGQCGPLLEKINRWHREHRRDVIAAKLSRAIENGDDTAPAMREFVALEAEPDGATAGIADVLAAREFSYTNHPPRPIPRFTLAEKPLCTSGNLTNVQAPPKAGKSAVVCAMLAAVFNGRRQGQDTLGFDAENHQGHALIHLDTEQSRFDADALVRRALKRAAIIEPPPWFHSYALADLGITERREALRHAMGKAAQDHGGVFAVMIDGIGDLCGDPNDSEEAFALVHELHALAIRHDCAIVTVLHENPGSETGKTRGHLGSQLERKAETNLRLSKDGDGITTIWAERARHCHLPKSEGPCFAWSDELMMHVSCGTAGEIKSAATRDKMLAEAEAAFTDDSMTYSDLVSSIMGRLEVSERTAKGRIKTWLENGITRKDSAGKHRMTES